MSFFSNLFKRRDKMAGTESLVDSVAIEPLREPVFIEWCYIPAGKVTIEKKIYRVEAFRMAKYPVTNAQFQVFIDAPDGYGDPAWWDYSEAARTWRKQNEAVESFFKGDKQPREMVCWYEAVALCRWLSAKTSLSITLPTEVQWQRAAQGNDGREYPWGNTFDEAKCNIDDSGAKQPVPVDRYPQGVSPYGVLDMSGNVWEWCLNESIHRERTGIDGTSYRALRGGSWYPTRFRPRIAAWIHDKPDCRSNHCGFRLIVGVRPPSQP